MVIAHYINNLAAGGAEKLLTDILPILKKNGNTVILIISNRKRIVADFEERLVASGVVIFDLNLSIYNPIQIFKLIKIVKAERIEIIHAHLFPTQYWLAIASIFFNKSTKLVKTEHSITNERRNYFFFRPLELFVYKRYHVIISITDVVRNELIKWLGEGLKMKTIINGVNLTQIENKSKDKIDFEISGTYSILMVSRFDFKAKNHALLVDAVSNLDDSYKLYFAGNGPNIQNIKDRVNKLGIENRVFFLGVRSDVYAIMSKATINVLATNYEGLSGVTLESLASGRPFIGSNVHGVKEIVPDDSFLFENNSPIHLASKIKTISESTEIQCEMIEKALLHIVKYDIKNMVNGYQKLYNELKNE